MNLKLNKLEENMEIHMEEFKGFADENLKLPFSELKGAE